MTPEEEPPGERAGRGGRRGSGAASGPGPGPGPERREVGPPVPDRVRAGERAAERERIFTPVFTTLMLANATLRVSTFMLIALVPLYALDQGVSPTVAGLTTTLYTMAALVTRPFCGAWVDSRGRYPALVVGALLYCLATGLYILTLPVWVLLAVRVIQGIGFSCNGTAVMTLATDLIPERRMSEGIGYLGAELTIAQIFGPWLALSLLNAYGYRWAFAVACVFSTVNLLIRIPLRSLTRRLDADRAGGERRGTRRDGVVEPAPGPRKAPSRWSRIVDTDAAKPSSVMFLFMFGAAAVNTFMVAYVTGRGIGNAGPFFTASGIMVAVARLTAGRAERRFGTAWVVGPGIALTALSQVAIWWSPNLGVLVLAGAVYGLGMGAVQPTLNSLVVLSVGRERRGRANSTFFMAIDLAQAVGAVTMGAVATATNAGVVFLMSALSMCGAIAWYFALGARGRAR